MKDLDLDYLKQLMSKDKQDLYYELRKIEKEFEYQKWKEELPFFDFPENWLVKIIPPFGRAIARFKVLRKDLNDPKYEISVYFDAYDLLGYYGKPYWEHYPDKDGDVGRFAMADTKGLILSIDETFDQFLQKVIADNG